MIKSSPDKIYHGSPAKFNKFDLTKIGSNAGITGASIGLYFTTSIEEALTYGPNIYVVDFTKLKLKKPLSNFKRTLNGKQIISLIDECLIHSNGENNFYDNYGDYHYSDYQNKDKKDLKLSLENTIVNSFLTSTDTEIIGELVNAGIEIDNIFYALGKLGFNYTMDQYDDNIFKYSQHYILYFEPKITEKLTFKNHQALLEYTNSIT